MFKDVSAHINKWGLVWGFVYALVALGFYFTGPMILLLGLASASTAIALQGILLQQFRWHFALLGVLMVFVTILLYMRRHGAQKLTMGDINVHKAYIGSLIVTFAITYSALFLVVAMLLRTR